MVTSTQLQGGMNGAEALVFWLGGFSDDPRFPISGPGGPSFDAAQPAGEILEDRKQRYQFERGETRPAMRAPMASTCRRTGSSSTRSTSTTKTAPAIRARRGRSTCGSTLRAARPSRWRISTYRATSPAVYDPPIAVNGRPELANVFAFKKVREGLKIAPDVASLAFENVGKFQLVHCGLDEAWGNFRSKAAVGSTPDRIPLFPEGPFLGDNADTLTNFTDSEISAAQP